MPDLATPEASRKVIVVGLLLVHPLKLVTLVPALLQPPETLNEPPSDRAML
jgi:hypothetical protein